jgi:hypothetical protein
MIRQIAADDTLGAHLALEALARALPPALVAGVLDDCGAHEQRRRKLPAAVTLLLCVAMNLYASECLPHVFRRLVSGLRWLWPAPDDLRVSKGAVCQARYRLGARPVVALFRRVCRPLATPDTPGAFLFGLRLLALDGTTLDVPDTPANVRAFGRPASSRGASAWPQLQLVALSECGTHAVCEAGVWRHDADERRAGRRLLRGAGPGTLLLWDRAFHSFDMVAATLGRGAHLLGRLPAAVKPEVVRALADGSALVQLRPSDHRRRRRGEQALVRLIRYTLDDPARPGHGAEHRLITSLLDPAQAPAEDLVVAYHARWEFEVAVDEVKTHQRPPAPLRSQKPVGVIQEVYGLLLAHYLVRAVMAEAAQAAALPPARLSFLGALRLIREALPDFQRAAPAEHPRLYRRLLAEIAATPLPPRATRSNPRVVKRKMSNFRVKAPAHRPWPQPTKPFRHAIVLLN